VSAAERTARGIAATLLVATGALHLRLYFDGYRDFPDQNLGRSFLLNALACGVVAVLVAFHRSTILLLAGLAVANGTLLGFALSRTDRGVFGFTERGFQPSPDASLSLVAEVGAAIALLAAFWLATRDQRGARLAA
jgi:hypothetical protein